MTYFSHIRAGLISTALLMTTALASPAFAETLPEISPRQIASDVEVVHNPQTGVKEYIAPSFDPFEEDRALAGTASLRSVSGATSIDGQSLRGGALLDLTFYYNSPSNDPYDTRGYEDAVYLSGEYAPVTLRDNRILECNEQVQDVVYYHEDYYRPSLHVNLFRPYRHYRGHHRFDRFYDFGRHGAYRGSRGYRGYRGYRGDRRVRDRHRDRGRNRGGLTDRIVDRVRERNDRTDEDRRTRDRGERGARGSTRRNTRNAETRRNDRDRRSRENRREDRADRRTISNDARTRRMETIDRAPRTPRIGQAGTPRAAGRLDRSRRAAPTVRGQNTPRAEQRRRRDAVERVDRAQSRGNSTAERIARRIESRSAPRAQPRTQSAPAPRPQAASRPAPAPRAERAAPRRERASNRASQARKSTNSPKRQVSIKGNPKRRMMAFLPMASSWSRNVVRNVDVQCAREERLSLHIPQERLDAARFDGLTVLVLDRSGQEVPVFIPPNYIEGFRQAVTGRVTPSVSYQEPRSSAPVYQAPQPTIESAPCPVGTTKQNDGTCLQGGTVTYGGYPTR